MKRHAATLEKPTEKPAAQSLLQRLERMDAETSGDAQTGHNRWMIPYADLLTLLLGLFLVIFTSGQVRQEKPTSPKPPGPVKVVRASEQPVKLQNRLQKLPNLQNVQVRQQAQGLVISLQERVLFEPGSADLSPEARKTLDRVLDELKKVMGNESRPIRIEGHTDDTPIRTARFPSNWELSAARATGIVRYLLDAHRVSPALLSAVGYAEFKPVADNSTIEGKQKNRRVDIVVLRPNVAGAEPPAIADKSQARD